MRDDEKKVTNDTKTTSHPLEPGIDAILTFMSEKTTDDNKEDTK